MISQEGCSLVYTHCNIDCLSESVGKLSIWEYLLRLFGVG